MNLQGSDNILSEELYRLAFKYIKDGDVILNLGCGPQFNFERTFKKLFRFIPSLAPVNIFICKKNKK